MGPKLYFYTVTVIILLFAAVYIHAKLVKRPKWKAPTRKKASDLLVYANTKDPMILSTLLIDADKLLEYAFKMSGLAGDTMGEKLKRAENLYEPNLYNKIWDAHKVRNQIAHEQDFKLRADAGKYHIQVLCQAIKIIASGK
jgi:hypothetical protein